MDGAQYDDLHADRILYEAALALQESDNSEGRAPTLDSLGDHDTAAKYCEQVLRLRQQLRNADEEVNTYDALVAVYLQLGELSRGQAAWTAAIHLYTTQHRLAEASQARLTDYQVPPSIRSTCGARPVPLTLF